MVKIIFRADGNNETGLGHLYRILALVEIYKDNFDYIILTRESTSLSAIPIGYKYNLIPDNISVISDPEWIHVKFPSDHYMIIADGYHFNSAYQKEIKKFNFILFYVDDLAKEYMYADVVINHSISSKTSDFKSEKYTKFALGPSYAIIRQEFRSLAKKKRIIDSYETVFIC